MRGDERAKQAADAGAGGFLPEAGPAAAGVEFDVSVKQMGAAADAVILAGLAAAVVFAAERVFGAALASHAKLFWRQPRAPLRLAQAGEVVSHVGSRKKRFY